MRAAVERVYSAPQRAIRLRLSKPRQRLGRTPVTEMTTTERAQPTNALGELLIVGPGVLGSYLAKLWIDRGGAVTGTTNTTTNHDRLRTIGVTPETYEDANAAKFSHVVYSAPPSGSSDYPASVSAALERWDGSGSFVFTSSTGVYPAEGVIHEDTPTLPMGKAPRTDRSLMVERAVIEGGGNVVRLGGLYHAKRGPHTFAISKGTISRPPNQLLTLIHYQDAARLILEVLLLGGALRKETLLAVEEGSITWQSLIEASFASELFKGDFKFEQASSESVPFRRFDNSKTVALLKGAWKPDFSFESFMRKGGQDWYITSGLW